MNRSELGLLAVVPALLYAVDIAAGGVQGWSGPAFIGALAGVAPVIGLYRRDLAILGWLPGLFFGVLLFTLSGISVNPLPDPLGDVVGGWAVLAPVFVGIAAIAPGRSPSTRSVLLVLAFLTAAAAVTLGTTGGFASPSDFANAFAQVPRSQAEALGAILTGGAPSASPFIAAATPTFSALLLLAGAGGLSGLLAVDPAHDPESLGFEGAEPHLPAGPVRSLLPDGRAELDRASRPERPAGADPSTILSVVIAGVAAVLSLVVAGTAPNDLIPGTAGAAILLLAASLLTLRSHSMAPPRPSAAPAGAAPAGERI